MNVVAVLIGALISSVISFRIATKGSKEILKRDAEARSEDAKAAISRTALALIGIIDEIENLRRYLKRQLAKKDHPGRERSEPWELVMPQVGRGPNDIPELDPDGLTVLFTDNELDLVQKMILLRRRAVSAMLVFGEYCTRREALRERLPPPVSFDGPLGRVQTTPEQTLALKVYTIPLNDLIKALSDHLEEDWSMAKEVADAFTVVARKHLDKPGFTMKTIEPGQGPRAER